MRSGGARADAPGRQQLRRGADPGRRAGARVRVRLPTPYPTKRKGAGLAALPPWLPTYLPTRAGNRREEREDHGGN